MLAEKYLKRRYAEGYVEGYAEVYANEFAKALAKTSMSGEETVDEFAASNTEKIAEWKAKGYELGEAEARARMRDWLW